MTRKDYQAIAEVIKEAVDNERNAGVESDGQLGRVAEGIASIMAQDNPNFDRLKFLGACGL